MPGRAAQTHEAALPLPDQWWRPSQQLLADPRPPSQRGVSRLLESERATRACAVHSFR